MKYTEKFPKPEGECPPHPGEEPKHPGFGSSEPLCREFYEIRRAWDAKKEVFNEYGMKMRKHGIAQALDHISSKVDATYVEQAVFVLGLDYLEKSRVEKDYLGFLFGGIR